MPEDRHLLEYLERELPELSSEDLEIGLEALRRIFSEQIKSGGRVELRGFGVFYRKKYGSRQLAGRALELAAVDHSGKPPAIPQNQRTVLGFRPSTKLKNRVHQSAKSTDGSAMAECITTDDDDDDDEY